MEGTRFAMSWKRWPLPVHSPVSTMHQLSSAWRGTKASLDSGSLSTLNFLQEKSLLLHRDTSKAHIRSYGTLQTTEGISVESKEAKVNIEKKSHTGSHNYKHKSMMEDKSAFLSSMAGSASLEFSLLMENINEIEDLVSNTDLVRLERDIVVHIQRLGALKLFHECLSRNLMAPTALNSNILLTENFGDGSVNSQVDESKADMTISTRKKELRKLKRKGALHKAARKSARSTSLERFCKIKETIASSSTSLIPPTSFSKSKSQRMVIARNESEMSKAVKEVAYLERTRINLEKETRQTATLAKWAEAAGIDTKMLLQRLQFGWYCRDELIRSTHSLVVYIARNYRGMGIAFDDLLQAGSMGVLQGAERFDNTRGYRFSTYVQYWIRKSMLALVAQHSRGIRVPVAMEKMISQIKKARRSLCNGDRIYPQDDEIANLTGLSLPNVRLASKCSGVISSIDQELGGEWPTKFTEITPDTSVKAPDEIVMRQHMRRDVLKLLESLHPRERRVLVLRYGLEDGRCKSLGEIGRLFHVTKEWIRKIEKAAVAKIKTEDIKKELQYYIHW